MTTEKIKQFLTDRPAISIRAIEIEAGLPSTTIAKAFKDRDIPEKHIQPIVQVLKKYGWKSDIIAVGQSNAGINGHMKAK